MHTEMTLLFVGASLMSILLYAAEYFPWMISAGAGAFSALFLFGLSFYWISVSTLPDVAWVFVLWGLINLVLTVILVFTSFKDQRGRFD